MASHVDHARPTERFPSHRARRPEGISSSERWQAEGEERRWTPATGPCAIVICASANLRAGGNKGRNRSARQSRLVATSVRSVIRMNKRNPRSQAKSGLDK